MSLSQSQNRRTVLIVEDDVDLTLRYSRAFQDEGYQAVCCGTAEEALDLLRCAHVDAAIVDFRLPRENGAVLIQRAINEGVLDVATTPTLICTAYSYVISPPGVMFVRKPVDPIDLIRKLEEHSLSSVSASPPASSSTNERPAPSSYPLTLRISGYDFVRAMLLDGYRLIGAAAGRALVTKGDVELWIPQGGELDEEDVHALLRAAGLSTLAFVALLNRLKSQETWPEPREVAPGSDVDSD